MLIRVEQGKGRRDRNAMLSPVLLELLRGWWKVCRSRRWLFPGRDPGQPITTRQLTRACHLAAQLAEINREQLGGGATAKARLPLLRQSDDYHREVRA
jgi:integrase/recombinase XerD